MEAIDVGKRIKSIRKRKGLTLQELAEKSGISATAISAIERNVSSPTVSTLAAVGRALGESLSSLLGESEVEYVVTRSDSRETLATDVRGIDFDSLASGIQGQRFQPLICLLKPDAGSGEDYINHRGEDFFYVIKGKLAVETTGKQELLDAGDGMYIRSNIPYRWKNAAEGETEILVVYTP